MNALTSVFTRIVGPAFFAALVLLSSALALEGVVGSGPFLNDFRAFYCAGQTAWQHQDPYRQQPLYACESRDASAIFWRASNNVAVPAPVLPVILASLAALSRFPYALAAMLWTFLGFAAFAAIVASLRALTALPYSLLVAVMAPALLVSLPVGQLAPMAMALACVSAVYFRKKNAFAGSMLLVSSLTIEPHVMLPSVVATFIFVSGARRWLVFFGVAAALISLSCGPALNIEYLFAVLPSQAASEVRHVTQFSLTLLLHLFGASDRLALAAGTVQYAVFCVVGIAAALYVAKSRADVAVAVTFPMAFAVFGGSYVHVLQADAAVPAIMMMCSWRRSTSAALALVFVAVPWLFAGLLGLLIPLMAVVAGVICWHLCDRPLLKAPIIGVLTLIALTFANHSAAAAQLAAPPAVANANGSSLAQASWAVFVAKQTAAKPGALVLLHVPTWVGLALTLGLILALCAPLIRSHVATLFRPARLVADA